MARKKKLKAVKSIEDQNGEEYLSEVDLLKYNYSQERLESAQQKIKLKMYESIELKRNADIRAAQLQVELETLQQFRDEIAEDLIQLQGHLKDTYKVDFSKDTYDDVTGLITRAEDTTDDSPE